MEKIAVDLWSTFGLHVITLYDVHPLTAIKYQVKYPLQATFRISQYVAWAVII